jgi:hypothetical protein
MNILGLISGESEYKHAIWMFLIGIPSIIAITAFRFEIRNDILLINTNHFDSVDQPILMLPYLTKLIYLYNQSTVYQIALDGFLDYHRKICDNSECVSKRRFMKTTKFSKQLR